MANPLVSIIINNYNYAKFLGEAIDSALNQTYPNTEVIVVDDGSTDNSQTIINSYGDRIIPVFKKNGGQASALNQGFTVSRGEIIIFLDADDYLYKQAVAEVVAVWRPNIAKVHYRLNLVDGDGKFLDVYPAWEISFDSGQILPTLLTKGRYSTTATSGNAFSRAALAQVIPIPEVEFRIGADGYLIMMIPFYGEIVALEKPLGVYRQHNSNFWSASRDGIQVDRFHKILLHDFQKYQILEKKSYEFGYKISHKLGFHDYQHLTARLISLRLAPSHHPVTSDTNLLLASKGFWAIWKYSEFSWKRRLILSIWFLWVGLMPKAMVEPMISWMIAAKSRPNSVDSALKILRFVTR